MHDPTLTRSSLSLRLVAVIYLLVTALSLLVMTQEIAFLFSLVTFHPEELNWNPGTLGGLYKTKPAEFSFYLMGCGMLGLYAFYIFTLISRKGLESLLALDAAHYPSDNIRNQIVRISVFISAQLLFSFLIHATSFTALMVHLAWWVILLQMPRIFSESESSSMKWARSIIYQAQMGTYSRHAPVWSKLSWIVVVLALLEFVYLMEPFFERPKIPNDFLNIPETTLMQGTEIDNLNFIGEHHLMGLHPIYDPRRDLGLSPAMTSLDFFMLGVGGEHLSDLIKSQSLASDGQSEKDIPALASLRQQEAELKNKHTSTEEDLFLEKNSTEIHWQILSQGVFHHQNHIYGPVNDFDLGRPSNEIFTQYGRFSIYLSWLLMYLLGGVSLGHVYLVSAFYYLTYYILIVAVAWVICKKREYVAVAALGATACYISLEFFLIYLSPGFGPIRHGLDLPALLCVYSLFQTRKAAPVFALLVICALATFNSNIWGLMLTGAFTVTLGCLSMSQFRSLPKGLWLVGGIGTFLIIALGCVYHAGPDISDYFLYGLNAYPSQKGLIFSLLFGMACLMVITVVLTSASSSPLGYTVIFWSIYCMGGMLYSIWGARFEHFWSVAPLYVLLILFILKLIADNKISWSFWVESLGLKLIMGCLIFIDLCGFFEIGQQHASYNEVFAVHKIYNWTYPRASIVSTINPKYLDDSVGLIKKYEPSNRVYILSQYDYLLPLLADKYSAMPFPDMSHFLLTKEDNQRAINVLRDQRPEFLFVDRDVKRVMAVDIVSPDSWINRLGIHISWKTIIPAVEEPEFGIMYNKSIDRAFYIYNLHSLFQEVEADYQPVESSLLLTVYKRRD